MLDEYLFEIETIPLSILENKYLYPLTERHTLYGILHIMSPQKIIYNSNLVGGLKHEGDYFRISNIEISCTDLCVTGEWIKVTEACEERSSSCRIEMTAEKICWETTADWQKPEMLGEYLGFPQTKDRPLPDWFREKYGMNICVEKNIEQENLGFDVGSSQSQTSQTLTQNVVPRFFDEFFYYHSYFHDGAVVDIKKTAKGYVLEMEGAEMCVCENRFLFPLSERNTLYGLLHIEGVKKIVRDSIVIEDLKKEGEFFGIYKLKVSSSRLWLTAEWTTLSAEKKEDQRVGPYAIEIEAETIYWENTAGGQPPSILGTYLGFPKSECHLLPYWFCEKHRIDLPEDQIGGEGHAATGHYHRMNPHGTNRHNECLDYEGNPCGRYENRAHIYSIAGMPNEP